MASTLASLIPQLLILSCLSVLFSSLYVCEAQTPPVVPGLSYNFYTTSCPNFESIVRTKLQTEFASDIGLAAGLLRMHFHDCFVQVCSHTSSPSTIYQLLSVQPFYSRDSRNHIHDTCHSNTA